MEFKSNIPIYVQVVSDIKKRIINGTLHSGDKLPSTRELANTYTINPNTAARVYSELESEHITFTKRGLGTFVSEDTALVQNLRHEMADKVIDEFISEMKAIGCTKEEVINDIKKKY
ncbi:MAG: GntR family transcriptional regulator [Lachnospiraceae bacterium]|nr:GntR family transcriptional regulator [Lachnospiraceae bacterium]